MTIREDRNTYYFGCLGLWGELHRAIYYIKNLIQDSSGNFSENIEFLAEHGDPQVIVHPAVMKAVDVIWYRLAMFRFVLQRLYSIFTLCVLLTGQSLLHVSTSRENIIVAVWVSTASMRQGLVSEDAARHCMYKYVCCRAKTCKDSC
eukprot:s538_g16.t1